MRTIKFQNVFDRIVRMLGRDPLAEVPQDMARAILEHVNERVEQIHQAWDWPEWTITEERAFRQIWNTTTQYKRVSATNGLPDEVFYLGASFTTNEFGTNYGYYRVKSDEVNDPPISTVPTNATYWESITQPIDAYIEYDQQCRRSIGRVIGVYGIDPRLNGCSSGLSFKPSEKGIDVRGNGNPTVFLTYLMPLPVYTIVPYVVGKTYVRGDTVFDPATGECFQAVDSTSASPGGAGWIWIPFLDKWATFVVQGAFADCLGEFDQGGNDDIQAKQAIADKAETKAMLALQARLDEFASQGQILKYQFCRNKCDCWLESVPFSGGSVTTLTEACQADLGWAYPPSPASASRVIDSMLLNAAASADGQYTGISIVATAGYTQSFGDLVYLDPTDSRWELVDANAAAGADGDARGTIGMVVVPGTNGTSCTILLQGIVRADAKFPTLTVGAPVYVSETPGYITLTQPTTTDVVIRTVGAAVTADEIYFNPSGTWITHQ